LFFVTCFLGRRREGRPASRHILRMVLGAMVRSSMSFDLLSPDTFVFLLEVDDVDLNVFGRRAGGVMGRCDRSARDE